MNEIEKAIIDLQEYIGSGEYNGSNPPIYLGTANMAISALEKQIPKKVDRVGNKCPLCKCYLASEPVGDHYCFHCGQAIDWSVEE